jgi:hypothetical protein
MDNASGGADVKAFSLHLNLPQTLTWTNKGAISNISRSQGITLNWSGGDPSSTAVITGSSSKSGKSPVGSGFLCLAPLSAGTFTVPPLVLLALPPSGTDSDGISLGYLSLGASTTPVKFTAPGLDLGYALSLGLSGKNVNYR